MKRPTFTGSDLLTERDWRAVDEAQAALDAAVAVAFDRGEALQARKLRRALAEWERACDERGHGVVLWDLWGSGDERVLIHGVTKTAVVTIGAPFRGAPGTRRRFCLRSGARIGGLMNERASLRIEAAPVEVLRRIVTEATPGTEWHDNAARLLAAAEGGDR